MNLFLDYQIKFIKCLKNLNAKNIILLPENLNSIKAEPPPKNQKSDLSFNAAMILAKLNKKSPDKIGISLKKIFLTHFMNLNKLRQ